MHSTFSRASVTATRSGSKRWRGLTLRGPAWRNLLLPSPGRFLFFIRAVARLLRSRIRPWRSGRIPRETRTWLKSWPEAPHASTNGASVIAEILFRNVIFRDFVSADFLLV